ncbi:MAG: hypothetical protein KA270_20155 [Saprospiraceae bacterium]|jgi:hypothetical protein|nr:hypothetical protein [Saprospiraceae bacterium]
MIAISKAVFFILFGINSLLVLFSLFSFFNLLLDPYKKLSEGLILLSGGIIIAVGLFLAYQYGYSSADFMKGIIILIAAFAVALVWIVIGLFFFNGPLHWQ